MRAFMKKYVMTKFEDDQHNDRETYVRLRKKGQEEWRRYWPKG